MSSTKAPRPGKSCDENVNGVVDARVRIAARTLVFGATATSYRTPSTENATVCTTGADVVALGCVGDRSIRSAERAAKSKRPPASAAIGSEYSPRWVYG